MPKWRNTRCSKRWTTWRTCRLSFHTLGTNHCETIDPPPQHLDDRGLLGDGAKVVVEDAQACTQTRERGDDIRGGMGAATGQRQRHPRT